MPFCRSAVLRGLTARVSAVELGQALSRCPLCGVSEWPGVESYQPVTSSYRDQDRELAFPGVTD